MFRWDDRKGKIRSEYLVFLFKQILFCPHKQFTEEKLGQAEKTELDAHLENLLTRAECTKHWTEKILKQTEVLLQPNPSKNIQFIRIVSPC